ncbi:CD209 antigen-like protein C [Penaeus japonicus]|uniref:CD209 antigen-like protein C n=1 Tax=Penaeus japonicus TaxID=27405 RepID=UPI001C712715|nr:CD209 antigen-like protein C [Penaeus japonicus]
MPTRRMRTECQRGQYKAQHCTLEVKNPRNMVFLVLLVPFLPLLTGSPLPPATTATNPQCPPGFHVIYGRCVQFRTEIGTWKEMKNECFNEDAEMVKVDDENFMYYLVEFINDNGLDGHRYWIGASDEDHEGTFTWTDGTEVKMGTPFWGDGGDQVQEPDVGSSENCVGLAREDHFFFFDYPCDAKRSVICESVSKIQ